MYRTVEHKHTDFYMYDDRQIFIFSTKGMENTLSERTHKLYIWYDHVHFLFNVCQNQTNTITCVSHVNLTYVSKVIF